MNRIMVNFFIISFFHIRYVLVQKKCQEIGQGQCPLVPAVKYKTKINNRRVKTGDASSAQFSSLEDCIIEVYCHCDAETGNTGQANFVKFDLSGVSIEPDSLDVIDIDTRSVEKGTEEHLAFGPCLYKVVGTNTTSNNLTINKNNTYQLEVETGRPYTLTEIKLIIKVISCPSP